MTSLSDFRVDAVAPGVTEAMAFKGEPVFRPGVDLIAFDQSIAATGWVHVVSGAKGVIVRNCGSISVPPDDFPKGHEGTLLRADALGALAHQVLLGCSATLVIHEMPPIATGRMSRPESSLVSAAVIRQVAHRLGHDIKMVSNQHSKKVLVGNGNATKPQWHKALDRLPWTHDGRKPSNEGQRDAFCLGLTWLIERGNPDV